MRDVYLKAKEMLGKKPVKKGEVIMSAEPFAYVIDAHQAGGYCENCLISSSVKNLKPCKLCGVVWYCSKNCETVGCQLHNYECSALQRLNPYVPPSFARLLLRILNKLKDGGEKTTETYGEFKNRKFKNLMNHYSDIRKDDTRMKDLRSIRQILISMMGEKNIPTESDFIGLYGRVLVNRFCLMDNRMAPIGSALYIKASIFDHSCEPNAYATFVGKNVEIRSLVDWPELDYDKVFISYLDLLNGTPHRRMELWLNWYFWCQCPLCTHKERIQYENCMGCENPDCNILVPVPEKPLSPFSQQSEPEPQCPSCGTLVKRETLEEYQSSVAYTRQRLKSLKETSTTMDLCLNVLEKQKSLFPTRNIWRVKALDAFFNAAYYNGIFSVALKWGTTNLDGMRYYYGPDHPTLGMFLMKLGKSLLYLKLFKEGIEMVMEADRILSMALGPRHHLVAEDIGGLKVMATEDPSILLDKFVDERKQREHEAVCTQCGKKKNKLSHEHNGDISHNENRTLITNGEISEETLKRDFPFNKNLPKRMKSGLKTHNQISNDRKVTKTRKNKRTSPKLIRKRSKKVLDYSLLFGNSSDEEEEEEDLTEEEVNARIAKILTKYSSSDGQWIWDQSKIISKNTISNGYISDKKSKNSIMKTGAKQEKEGVYSPLQSTENKKNIKGKSDNMLSKNNSGFNEDKSQGNSNLDSEALITNSKNNGKKIMTKTTHISPDIRDETESKLSMNVGKLDRKRRGSKGIMKKEINAGTSKSRIADETSEVSPINELLTEPYSQVPLDSSPTNQKSLTNSMVDNKFSQENGTMENQNSKLDSQSSFKRDKSENSELEHTPNGEKLTKKTLDEKIGDSDPIARTTNNELVEETSEVSLISELPTEPNSQVPLDSSPTDQKDLTNSIVDNKFSQENGTMKNQNSNFDSQSSFNGEKRKNSELEHTPNGEKLTKKTLDEKIGDSDPIARTTNNELVEETSEVSLISELPTEPNSQVPLDSSPTDQKSLTNSIVDNKFSQENGTMENQNSKLDSQSSFKGDKSENSELEHTPNGEKLTKKTLDEKIGDSDPIARTTNNELVEETSEVSLISELPTEPNSQVPLDSSPTDQKSLTNSIVDNKFSQENGTMENKNSKLDSQSSFKGDKSENSELEHTPNGEKLTKKTLDEKIGDSDPIARTTNNELVEETSEVSLISELPTEPNSQVPLDSSPTDQKSLTNSIVDNKFSQQNGTMENQNSKLDFQSSFKGDKSENSELEHTPNGEKLTKKTLEEKIGDSDPIARTTNNELVEETSEVSLISELPTEPNSQVPLDSSPTDQKALTNSIVDNKFSQENGTMENQNSKLDSQSSFKGDKSENSELEHTPNGKKLTKKTLDEKIGDSDPIARTTNNELVEETSEVSLISELPTEPNSQVPLDSSPTDQKALTNSIVDNKFSQENGTMKNQNSNFDSQSSFNGEKSKNSELEHTPNGEKLTKKTLDEKIGDSDPIARTTNNELVEETSEVSLISELPTETNSQVLLDSSLTDQKALTNSIVDNKFSQENGTMESQNLKFDSQSLFNGDKSENSALEHRPNCEKLKKKTLDEKIGESKEIKKRESIARTTNNELVEETSEVSLISELPTEPNSQVPLDSLPTNQKSLTNYIVDNKFSQENGTMENQKSKLDSQSSFSGDKSENSELEHTPNGKKLTKKTLDEKMRESKEIKKRGSIRRTKNNELVEEISKTSQVPLGSLLSNHKYPNISRVSNKFSKVNGTLERENSKLDSQFTNVQNKDSAKEPALNKERVTNDKLKRANSTISGEEIHLNLTTSRELDARAKESEPSTQRVLDGRFAIENKQSLANGIGENSREIINPQNKTESQNLDTLANETKHKTRAPKRPLDYSLIYGNSSDESEDSDSEVSMTEDEVYIRLSLILSKYSLPNGKMIWEEPKKMPPKVSGGKSMLTSKVENTLESIASNCEEKLKNDRSSCNCLKINNHDNPFKSSPEKSISENEDGKMLTIDSKSKRVCKLDEKNPGASYKSTLVTANKTTVNNTNVEVDKDINGHKTNDPSIEKPEKPKLRMFDTTMGNRVILRY